MSATRRLRRSAPLAAVACAMLAANAAAADPLAQESYYSSYGEHGLPPTGEAQEQYYSSYGEPEPLGAAPSSDDGPWLPIVLSLGGALVVVAVSTTQARRVRIRRRRAAGIAA
jgi:hypothetical protein